MGSKNVHEQIYQERRICMKEKFLRFMQGRYGVDQFSKGLLIAGLVVVLLSSFFAGGRAGSVEPEAQTEVMQKNQGIAVILKFPVISTVIIAVLLFGAVGIRKLTMNPVKQMEEYAGLYMVSTSGK